MELPVVNKKKADFHIVRLIAFILLLYFAFYALTRNWSVILYYSIFNIFVSILLFRYHRKNNFSVSFEGKEFTVKHRGLLTSIPVTEIWDIKFEINNYLGAKDWQLAVVYTLYLRKVYPFGDEIHLSYTLSKETIEKGPEFIQCIKKLIENDA